MQVVCSHISIPLSSLKLKKWASSLSLSRSLSLTSEGIIQPVISFSNSVQLIGES